MAAGACRFDDGKHRIAVAVRPHFYNRQRITRRFALCPQAVAAAAPKGEFFGVECFFERGAVCKAGHKHFACRTLRDNGNKTARVFFGFVPIQAGDKAIFQFDRARIERHAELNVDAQLFKFFDFPHGADTACSRQPTPDGLSQRPHGFHIGSAHAAFFFDAGKKQFARIFFGRAGSVQKRNAARLRPAFYADDAVARVDCDDNTLFAYSFNQFIQKIRV